MKTTYLQIAALRERIYRFPVCVDDNKKNEYYPKARVTTKGEKS